MGLLSGGLPLGGGSLGSFGKLGMLPSLGSMGSFGRSMGMSNGNGSQLGAQRMSEGVLLQLLYLMLSDSLYTPDQQPGVASASIFLAHSVMH